jgi:hypothetical protein
MDTKLVELFANRMVKRRNMIMSIKGGELTLSVRGSFEFFSFSFSLLFSLVCRFSCLLMVLRLFLLLDDLFELFVGFWSSSYGSWGLEFEIQTLCFLLSIEKLSG